MEEHLKKEFNISSNKVFEGIQKALDKANKYKKDILFSYTFRFNTIDLLPIITHPSDRENYRFFWEKPIEGISLVGLGSIWSSRYKKNIFYKKIIDKINFLLNESVLITEFPNIGPKIIGGHAFNMNEKSDQTWEGFPRSYYYLPECLVMKNDDGCWITLSQIIKKNSCEEKIYNNIIKLCSHYQNKMPVILPPVSNVEIDKYKDIPNKEKWNKAICSVLTKIHPKKIEKVVISRSHQIKLSNDFSVSSVLQILRNTYTNCTTFMLGLPKTGIFFGSSPEKLIYKKNDFIKTEALAGTQARGKNMEEDRLFSETLINSHKENTEHQLVVKQIRKKLNFIAKKLNIQKLPEIMKLTNVQHLKTPISAHLKKDEHILNLVKLLHPTPAVAGTPTDQAMKIIDSFEINDRGWYSGPIGWFDKKGNGEFNVALRSAFVKNGVAHIFVGSGIVSESIPDKEWDETELKLAPILTALSGGQF